MSRGLRKVERSTGGHLSSDGMPRSQGLKVLQKVLLKVKYMSVDGTETWMRVGIGASGAMQKRGRAHSRGNPRSRPLTSTTDGLRWIVEIAARPSPEHRRCR